MDIGDILTVSALSEKGILYGGTSISQILSQDEGHDEIPKGQVRDYPQYAVRAVMLDVARTIYPARLSERADTLCRLFQAERIPQSHQ